MSPSAPPAAVDLAEEAASLIRDVGRCSQLARRYRELATSLADPTFDRALAIGTLVRQHLRTDDDPSLELRATVAELRSLLNDCQEAIVRVRAGALYREILEGFRAGSTNRVAQLAPDLFTDVIPEPADATLFWPVPIAGKEPGVHFLAPSECAARIVAASTSGFPAATAPPELGTDDQIGAVVFSDEHDASESPVALVVDGAALLGHVCRLAGTSTVLYYAPRLMLPFAVHATATPTDEWWAVRPNAYPAFLDQLRNALRPTGIRLEVADRD